MINWIISIGGMLLSLILMVITGDRKHSITNDFFYRLSFVLFSLFLLSLLFLLFIFMYGSYFVKG